MIILTYDKPTDVGRVRRELHDLRGRNLSMRFHFPNGRTETMSGLLEPTDDGDFSLREPWVEVPFQRNVVLQVANLRGFDYSKGRLAEDEAMRVEIEPNMAFPDAQGRRE
ncbi:MAG: hypothetical protein HYS32_02930 [Candidatus Woesearchaeota archaeon]|nr:MAG: hypothetical protein HYS32_02930 [Candidatus Woesearchaeota archaeon]